MLWGLVVSIPMMLLSLFYIRRVGKAYYRVPNAESWITSEADWANLEVVTEVKDEELPNNFLAFGPSLIPIVLILVNTLSGEGETFFHYGLQLIGNPIVAVGLGVLMA